MNVNRLYRRENPEASSLHNCGISCRGSSGTDGLFVFVQIWCCFWSQSHCFVTLYVSLWSCVFLLMAKHTHTHTHAQGPVCNGVACIWQEQARREDFGNSGSVWGCEAARQIWNGTGKTHTHTLFRSQMGWSSSLGIFSSIRKSFRSILDLFFTLVYYCTVVCLHCLVCFFTFW